MPYFLGFLFIIGAALAVYLWFHLREERRSAVRRQEQRCKNEELALALSPGWQAKIAGDREHERKTAELALKRQELLLKEQTEALRLALEQSRFEHQRWIDLHIAQPETYRVNTVVESVLAFPALKMASPAKEADRANDDEMDYPPISLRSVVDELPYNQLAFAFGTVRTTGELLQTTLPDALHTQIAGSTEQGKSVESGGILTQLCVSNDSDHLQLALLDSEGETTIPFRGLPHMRHLADNPDQAAKTLRNLVKELNYRDTNRQPWPRQAAILIFIEEFLSLKRIMSPHLRGQALEDFTELAIRGRKRWMYLFVIGQTAYVDKETRDAQRQFQSILTFAMPPAAARAAGMTGNSDMLNKLWTQRQKGQFLLQGPVSQGDQFVLAPRANSEMIHQILATSGSVPGDFPTTSGPLPETQQLSSGNTGGQHPELDFSIVERMRQMLSASNAAPSQKKIIEVCFPDMRNSDALKLYWKYLAALVAEKERGA